MRDFDCPRIMSDNRAAAYDITDYVLSLGHRRVAYISGPAGLYASRDRLEGFRQAASDAGVEQSSCTRATSPMSRATRRRCR